jgi:hypothetical protein
LAKLFSKLLPKLLLLGFGLLRPPFGCLRSPTSFIHLLGGLLCVLLRGSSPLCFQLGFLLRLFSLLPISFGLLLCLLSLVLRRRSLLLNLSSPVSFSLRLLARLFRASPLLRSLLFCCFALSSCLLGLLFRVLCFILRSFRTLLRLTPLSLDPSLIRVVDGTAPGLFCCLHCRSRCCSDCLIAVAGAEVIFRLL